MEKPTIDLIRKLSQQYAYDSIKMHEVIAAKAGLPGTDHKYLGFLMVKGQMTAGELAQLSGLSTGAVTGLIDRFEKKKLVKRQFDSEDRRKVFIVPNIKNIMALLNPLFGEFGKKSEQLIAAYSKKELQTINSFLSKSIGLMNETIEGYNDNSKPKNK